MVSNSRGDTKERGAQWIAMIRITKHLIILQGNEKKIKMKCLRCGQDTMKLYRHDDERYYKCYECNCWGYARDSDDRPEIGSK